MAIPWNSTVLLYSSQCHVVLVVLGSACTHFPTKKLAHAICSACCCVVVHFVWPLMRRCHAWDNVVIVPYFLVTYRTWLYTISNSSDQIILSPGYVFYNILSTRNLNLDRLQRHYHMDACVFSLTFALPQLSFFFFFFFNFLLSTSLSRCVTCVWMYIFRQSGTGSKMSKCRRQIKELYILQSNTRSFSVVNSSTCDAEERMSRTNEQHDIY